jgi:hypothetical protein
MAATGQPHVNQISAKYLLHVSDMSASCRLQFSHMSITSQQHISHILVIFDFDFLMYGLITA